MQFRCYSCGLVFRDGIPPLEALSIDQLGTGSSEIHHDLLYGTPYEGLSTFNFCMFCLTAIQDFPLAQFNKSITPGHEMRFRKKPSTKENGYEWFPSTLECECGYEMHPTDTSKFRHSIINREMVMHLIEDVFYAENTNLSEIRSLVQMEV